MTSLLLNTLLFIVSHVIENKQKAIVQKLFLEMFLMSVSGWLFIKLYLPECFKHSSSSTLNEIYYMLSFWINVIKSREIEIMLPPASNQTQNYEVGVLLMSMLNSHWKG